MTAPNEYNDGYTHEAWHTMHVLMDMFDCHVVATHCVDEFPDVKAAADVVMESMWKLYSLIGQKFTEEGDGEGEKGHG